MKLQIISRLTKNQGRRYDSIRDCVYTQENFHTDITDRNPKICEYYSIKTDSIEEKKQNNGKANLREFFNNFDVLTEIKYTTVSNQVREVKRKLEPKLQVLKSSRNNAINFSKHSQKHSQDCTIKEQKPAFNLNNCLDEIRSSLKLQSHHNYHVQKARQKIRKVNSLISFDTQSSTIQQAMRKPGFIKTNRSLAKKQSSLQISKICSNKQNQDNNIPLEKKASSKQNIQIDNQINESKQRIAKIRKQLNQIYQMRGKPTELKLRLN